MSGRIFSVATKAEFLAAIAKATGGDRIELAEGNYGDVKLSGLAFSDRVTITSADPDKPASFNSVGLSDVANLSFDNLRFDFKPTAATVEWSAAFRADSCTDISVTRSKFTGGDAVAGAPADTMPGDQGSNGIEGQAIGVGITVNWSENIVISDNEISHFSAGVRFNDVDEIEFNNNEIFDFRRVPVGGAEVSNVHMEGNHFHDPNPWNFGGAGDHGDFVHFWTNPDQTEPSENFVIRGNFFKQGDGTAILGIYLDDNTNQMGFRNVLIEDNVIHNGSAQALRMEWVDGLVVRDNTLLQSSGDAFDAPKIGLVGQTRNVLIEENIYAGVTGSAMADPKGNNIRITDNLVVQIHDPLSPNYVGDLFVGGVLTNGMLNDFLIVPGSIAAGYGADISFFDKTPAQMQGFIAESRGDGLDMATHSFDAQNIYASWGKVSLVGATIEWDFGDGTTGTGAQISHDYAHAGAYVVTATITRKSGGIITLDKTVTVLSPVALQADFEKGIADISDSDLDTTVTGAVRLQDDAHGTAVRVGTAKSTVKFEAGPEILNNPEFTIQVAFKKDAGAEGLGGRLLYFSGTAVIDLSADGITLRGKTSADESFVLQDGKVGIRDTDWHQITYAFSQEKGTAILYVDGQEVARVEGLTGAQYTTSGHGLHLGNPFGTSFSGLMDNVAFLRAALTPAEVQESYDAFQRGEMLNYGRGEEVVANLAEPEAVIVAAPEPEAAPVVAPTAPPADLGGYTLDPQALAATALQRGAQVVTEGDTTLLRLEGDGDYVNLGRLTQFETTEQLAFSVDFRRGEADGSTDRLVWNHTKVGLTLAGDGFILQIATADEGFKSFAVSNVGLNDTDLHRAVVVMDGAADRVQVFVDDKLLLDETDTDIALTSATSGARDWTLGTAWNRYFDGDITDFQVSGTANFIDTAL